jgi:DNA repair protein RadC
MTVSAHVARRRTLAALRLVKEVTFPAPPDFPESPVSCHSPRHVFEFMKPFAERETVENFWIVPLDARHNVLHNSPVVITRGILNSSLVHPREVFRASITVGAAAILLVHNHPSGDPTPSADDRAITAQLVAAGRLLDIPVADHVIVGRGRYVSFAEGGML